MKTLFRPLALATALGVGGIAGTNYLTADEPKVKPAEEPPAKISSDDLRRVPGRVPPGLGAAQQGPAAADSKPDTTIPPVKVTDAIAKTEFAVKPKELSPAIKKGLEYLVKIQQDDGGWNQGGGWRVGNTGGGRVEGKNVEDPSDIGNTCFVLLACSGPGTPPPRANTRTPSRRG
jgi:hypothetical protein